MIDGLIKIVIESIKEITGGNALDLTIYFSILVLFFWLFKEFRNKLIDEETSIREKENNVLMEFLELEFELEQFYSNKSNFEKLKEKLVKVYPYLSYSLSKKISSFNIEMENEVIRDFINDIVSEKNIIKSNQLDYFSNSL